MFQKKEIYRNEWKYYISKWEAEYLKQRLSGFLKRDANAVDGKYMIRSLYFDDYWNSSYNEKMMGIEQRTKWRIRNYNLSDSSIKLERKKKWGSYIHKDSAEITRKEFEQIIKGDYCFLLHHNKALCREFYYECVVRLFRPKIIVDYDREPFVQQEGDVRITFDYDVRAGITGFDLFDPAVPTLSALEENTVVLEVKFTEFIPDIIKRLLPSDGGEFSAISKYTLCYERAHYLTDVLAGVEKTDRRGIR